MTRVAVVGHVEWIEFARVPRVPKPGEIVHATEWWEDVGGGGAVAAVQLAKLAGGAEFFTALAQDERGRRSQERLQELGVTVYAAPRPGVQRRGFVYLDDDHERTITIRGARIVPHGDDDLPWDRLDEVDAVYFTGGDVGALQQARRAHRLVATPRAYETLRASRVNLDALVRSAKDPGEQQAEERLDPAPDLVVSTAGKEGGEWVGEDRTSGRWQAAQLPGPPRDSYGAGDSFAAGLTFGLGAGLPIEKALDVASRCGAYKLAGRAPYDNQLTAADL
jgi:ribokinase